MVCKNCGADLKPGIKYCLECGCYLDDDDNDELDETGGDVTTSYQPVTLRESSAARKRRRLNLTLTDYLIYAGLLIIMIGSIIVIIVAVVRNNSQPKQPVDPNAGVIADKILTIDNYKATVPGKYNSTVQGSTLYVSDNVNYTFSYQNSLESFDSYVNDRTKLENDLAASKYEILTTSEKTINSRLFLIYEIKVNGTKKVLYLTKGNDYYTTMGIIEIMTNGNWEEALPVIDIINNSLEFDN